METTITSLDVLRAALGRRRRDLAWVWGLRGVRPSVVWFQWRARRIARRTGDTFSLVSVTRPADTQVLIGLARGRSRIVELGTATGWTAITLALDDLQRRVVSYDVVSRGPERYLELVPRDVRNRIELVLASGSTAPTDGQAVDLLYIDSSREHEQTMAVAASSVPAGAVRRLHASGPPGGG